VAVPTVFVVVLLVFCLAYGIIPGPEVVVLCFFTYAAYDRRSRRFVKDWFPFVALFLGYEAFYGLIPSLSGAVHVVEPIDADLRLFGFVPTLVLQQFYRSPFLDYLGAFFYSLHFILPVAFAFVLWRFYPKSYGRYTLTLVLGTYAALLTFLFYPVAPPWSGVHAVRVLFQLDQNLGVPFYRTFFDLFRSDPNAAFPSLHSMYPWLVALYAFKLVRVKALPVLALPFGVWFSAVYLGEHYVVDVIGGVVYGTCAFLFVEKVIPYIAEGRLGGLTHGLFARFNGEN
jgi:membrane-associated phospholipid phosphatase